MWNWLERFKAMWAGKPYCERASGWPALRKAHLTLFPRCAVCDRKASVVPHHLDPVHLFPGRELDPTNLITLCEGGAINCHMLFGHLGEWRSYNTRCAYDAKLWHKKLEERP